MAQRWASISVDLDSLPHYCRIHGLPESLLNTQARTLVYDVAVPRFLALLAQANVTGTFFVIGEELQTAEALQAVRAAHVQGVELANHSYHHDYALTRQTEAGIFDDVWRGHQALQRAVGAAPVGFRAPGYTLTASVYRVLEQLGYAYDSSVFPATAYYAAKAGVMGWRRLRGDPSRAVLDSPTVLRAPLVPYRPDPDHPYRPGTGAVLEMPMAVSPGLRVPFIGTLAAAWPYPFVRGLYQTLRRVPHFNFELHAIDLLDADDGIPLPLVNRQPDLRVPHSLKRTRLLDVLRWVRHDFDVVSLKEAAGQLAAASHSASLRTS